MARKTVTAWVVGVLASVALGALAARRFPNEADHDHLLAVIDLALTVACTLIALGLLKRWMGTYSSQVRKDIDTFAEQRHVFNEGIKNHLADIARREEALNARALDVETRMNDVLQALIDERAAGAALRQENDELTRDYNRAVSDSLQQTADLFRGRAPSTTGIDGLCIPMPVRSPEGHVEHDAPHVAADPAVRN
ncbi:hypothetical protein ACFY0N_00925 [Streptomyces vinaceus]|uniref:hypothetical protein n=1 Tax=Streptomyces vinaceus TaxID=1960 RepID=UPI0036801124